jgi:type II secretory pathway pseudopilin PulG
MRRKSTKSTWQTSAHTSQDDGFTRLDLMVVMGIFLMLVLVVLPALARSGDQGRRMVCMNNLKQMGMASIMYATENRDYLAFCNWDGGADYGPGWLYRSVGGVIPSPTATNYVNNPAKAYESGIWFRYVLKPSAYLCPVDIESPYYTKRANKLSSYLMNGAVAGYPVMSGSKYRTCKVTDVWNPACYLLWEPDENANGPGNPGSFAFNDGANYPIPRDGGVGLLHTPNGSEILSVNGSVQFVTKDTFNAESAKTGKSLTWWSPFSSNGR